MDGVARYGRVVRIAVREHVEHAGVHSGDATLVLPPPGINISPAAYARFLHEARISALYATPATLSSLSRHGRLEDYEWQDLRLVLFAGDVMPPDLLEKIEAFKTKVLSEADSRPPRPADDAGLPPGIAMISITGSVGAGKAVARASATERRGRRARSPVSRTLTALSGRPRCSLGVT